MKSPQEATKRRMLLALLGLAWPLEANAQVLEIVRELGTPVHRYSHFPGLLTVVSADIPFPATPNVQFAISSYDAVRLRLVAPAGSKFVCTQGINLSWPGDLNLIPVGSGNSGPLNMCPTSWSINSLTGTPPVSNVQGFKTDGDWLKIRATATSASSANFEFTEVVLEWDVSAFSGASHEYMMQDGGGMSGPELNLYRSLPLGAPDPGPSVSLQPILPECLPNGATWTGCGVPMAVKPGPQLSTFMTSDGSGGAVLTYTHRDSFASNDTNIWLNRVDANGNPTPGWPADGVAVTALPGLRGSQRVALGGNGGSFVAWEDTRNDPSTFFVDIYLQHITSTGARGPGWPVNGLALTNTPSDDEFLTGLVEDGNGGAYVLWTSRILRVNEDMTTPPGWPTDGLAITNGSGRMIADGAGGVYVGWSSSTNGLRVTRITALGAYAPGWTAAGVQVALTATNSFSFDLGAGGSHVNVAWTTSTGNVRASRVTSGGSLAAGWPASGVLVSTNSYTKASLNVVNGGASGDVNVVWREDIPDPFGDYQVVAQRLTSTGTIAPSWPAQGWIVIPNFSQHVLSSVRAVSDCAAGMTLAWVRGGIRALRITPSATVAPGWPADGIVACGGSFTTAIPNPEWVCSDGTGGVITAIPRGSSGPGSPFDRMDIYAQCVRGDGTTLEAFTGNTPIGSGVVVSLGPVTMTFPAVTVEGPSLLELEDSGPPSPFGLQIVPTSAPLYYDLTTSAQFQGPIQICITYDPTQVQGAETGLQLLHYDTTLEPPGWTNVTTSLDVNANVICGSTPTLSPFVIVEADPTDAVDGLPRAVRLLTNVPNPFNPTTTIHYELSMASDIVLDIVDVSGTLVRTLVHGRIAAGRRSVVWEGRDNAGHRVASGVYFYRLRAGSFVETRRMVLLK